MPNKLFYIKTGRIYSPASQGSLSSKWKTVVFNMKLRIPATPIIIDFIIFGGSDMYEIYNAGMFIMVAFPHCRGIRIICKLN